MNGLVTCKRMGTEIQISPGQCRRSFQEAEEWQERGWPLYIREKCLVCGVGASLPNPPVIPVVYGANRIEARILQIGPDAVLFACSRGRRNAAPTKANAPRHQVTAAPAAAACRICGAAAYKKAGLCFDHLLAETQAKVEYHREAQGRHLAKKRAQGN